MQTLFIFLTKQATLMRRSTVLSLPLQLVFPYLAYLGIVMTSKKPYRTRFTVVIMAISMVIM
jgi:hypothetical protein